MTCPDTSCRDALDRAFGRNTRIVLPVVHVLSDRQAFEQIDRARSAGADGAWLIDHDGTVGLGGGLVSLYHRVNSQHPDFWVGCNFLGLDPRLAYIRAEVEGIPGVWSDSSGDPREMVPLMGESPHGKPLYFGGVAFKYQKPVQAGPWEREAVRASTWMDVPTTSGDATGLPPEVSKIALFREVLDSHPLGIASGMTPDNVGDFVKLADCFLVATGVSRNFHEFEPSLLEAFVEAVHDGR